MTPSADPAPPSSDAPPSSHASATPGSLRRPDEIGLARLVRRLRTIVRLWRLYWLRLEIRFVPSEAQRLFALTIVIGVLCGLAAVAFHFAIRKAEGLLIENAMSAHRSTWMAWTILTPMLGAMGCGALLQYVVPEARGSGIPRCGRPVAAAVM